MTSQQIKSVFSLIITLSCLYFIRASWLLPFVLLPIWYLTFRPLNRPEIIMFVIGSLFIIGQNFSVLRAGGFAFTQQDFLLMPYYEPFMWGFYYLNMKRFISEDDPGPSLGIKPLMGLIVTGSCFTFFPGTSDQLLIATFLSTTLLLVFFHTPYDLYFGTYALGLGFIIEIFGISSGLWTYPDPDFLGMPFWFAFMWISVGILGRRVLIPLSNCIDSEVIHVRT